MKNKVIYLGILSLITVFTVSSCSKGAGEGGKASIHGKLKIDNYDATFSVLQATYYAQGENVYIIYGDHITYDNSVKTNYDGTFEFPYLRPGDYTIFAYGKDTAKYLNGVPNPNGSVITSKTYEEKITVTISGKKDAVDAGEIKIIR